ncbi:MAG: SEL1-like repeat protein [Nitrosomonadales bacterium]|nr:SEL1-like repeat protein [Nitrosomonadales bacterium]
MKTLLTTLILSYALLVGIAHADDLASTEDKALVHDANAALAQKDYKTAFSKFSILAEQGKTAAQFNMGAFYLNGQGVPKDDMRAFEWFRKSAAQGNPRALQVIENAAAKGNVYAVNELKKLRGQTEPAKAPIQPQETAPEKPLEKPKEMPVEKPQEKPQVQARVDKKAAGGKWVYSDPTVAAPGKWVSGISAELSSYKATEPLYYPVGGVLNYVTQSYSASQPDVGAWVGNGDITVMASYGRRSGNLSSSIPGVGSVSKSFRTNEAEIDVRWLIRSLSSGYFSPYVLFGYALNSTNGTGNEIDFLDNYSQKDSMLMVGAGAIIPVNEKIGFRVDGRYGRDKQTSSGNYVANPGVTLSFTSYQYAATATYTRITAAMYYKFSREWNAQLSARRGNYSAGIGPAFSDTGFCAMVGYAYR